MNVLAGSDFFRQFGGSVKSLLKNGNWILFEVGQPFTQPAQGDSIAVLAGKSYGPEFKALLLETPNLKWVHTEDTGISEAFYQTLVDRDILISRSTGANAPEVTEFVFAAIFWSIKRLRQLYYQHLRATWKMVQLESLEDKTILIVGLGSIGSRVAKIAKSFGMRVLGIRKTPVDTPDVDKTGSPGQLQDYLHEADIIVLALPLLPETTHMIDVTELDLLKDSATIINVSRGSIINIGALKVALKERKTLQAILDVMPVEPWPSDDELWSYSNVFITPHNAFVSPLYQARVAEIWRENLQRYLEGKPLHDQVQKEDLG